MIGAVLECCAGIDVGKKFVVVCLMTGPADGEAHEQTRKFGTNNGDLEKLRDWLSNCGCFHVVMESTGAYWKPIFNVLEEVEGMQVVLANSQQVKNLRGHKTDPNDSRWLAHLLRHGMIRPSYVPPRAIRDLRDFTRRRKQLVRAGVQERNRVQAVLEDANIKIGNVLSDLFGLSGQLMIEALVEGQATVRQVAELAQKQAKKKIPQIQAALEGHRMSDTQRALIRLSMAHLAFLEEQIAQLEEQIFSHIERCGFQHAHALLQTIPGIKKQAAAAILAEVGTDMGVFGKGSRCSSWAGVCPGNNESAGKRKRAPVLRGNPWLRTTLIECAWGASNKTGSVFQARYQRLAPRIGHKRAIVAVAHSLVLVLFEVLNREQPYTGSGADAMPVTKVKRLIRHHSRRVATLRKWLIRASSERAVRAT
jgi:transposase